MAFEVSYAGGSTISHRTSCIRRRKSTCSFESRALELCQFRASVALHTLALDNPGIIRIGSTEVEYLSLESRKPCGALPLLRARSLRRGPGDAPKHYLYLLSQGSNPQKYSTSPGARAPSRDTQSHSFSIPLKSSFPYFR